MAILGSHIVLECNVNIISCLIFYITFQYNKATLGSHIVLECNVKYNKLSYILHYIPIQ